MIASAYAVRPTELPGLSPTARRSLTDWIARVRESDRRACGTPSRAPLAALPAGSGRCTASVDVEGGWPAPAALPAWATTLAPDAVAAHLWAVRGTASRSPVSEPPRVWIVRYTTPTGGIGEYRLHSEDAASAVLRQITGRAPRATAPRVPRTRTAPAPAPAPAPAAPAPAPVTAPAVAPAPTVPRLPPPLVHAGGTDGETLRARLDRACAALYAARAAVRDAAPDPADYPTPEDHTAAADAWQAALDAVQGVFDSLALAHDDVLAQLDARAAARNAA